MDLAKKKERKVQMYSSEKMEKKVEETHKAPLHTFAQEVKDDIDERATYKVIETINGEPVDLTPKEIVDPTYEEVFATMGMHVKDQITNLTTVYSQRSVSRGTRSSVRQGLAGMKQSMDELMTAITQERIFFSAPPVIVKETKKQPNPYTKPFLRIILRRTDNFLLFEQNSQTAPRGSVEGDEVEKDNKYYDYMTVGKGKVRRRSDAETQTESILMKSRLINTIDVRHANVKSYVSNFEMYDTMRTFGSKTSFYTSSLSQTGSLIFDDAGKHESLDMQIEDKAKAMKMNEERIYANPKFQLAKMIIGRAIASNIHEMGMRRFRNFDSINRFSRDASYNYSLKLLFRFAPVPSHKERKAVADMNFCNNNGDIVAIAYGLFSFSSHKVPSTGDLFVWSIKNPCMPERAYYYKKPVTAVRFSPFVSSLLAIGFFDGTVEVRDVTAQNDGPIAVSQRSSTQSCSPVVSIRWIRQGESSDANEVDPFLALSQDGSVERFRIIKSPFLRGFNQMILDRIEGQPEGIRYIQTATIACESNRHPQGLCMITHPLYPDIYYVLTDEGCIHKCSINYQHQYLEVLMTHEAGVNCMDFSPWSPKLFLTCGNDWCIRIWIEGIFRPLIELRTDFEPVNCAHWSPTHSTIILSLTRSKCQIWDIRRNILQPMAAHSMDSSNNTIFKFSRCGRTIVVGNERGNALCLGMDDMPFPAHFQYDELEKAIYKAIGNDGEMMIELKSVGFFGYPDKGFRRT